MHTPGWQEVLVALAVAAAVGYSAWRFVPGVRSRLLPALAHWLDRAGRPAPLRRLGARLAPAGMEAGDCGSCSQCGPRKPAVHAAAQPVRIVRDAARAPHDASSSAQTPDQGAHG